MFERLPLHGSESLSLNAAEPLDKVIIEGILTILPDLDSWWRLGF